MNQMSAFLPIPPTLTPEEDKERAMLFLCHLKFKGKEEDVEKYIQFYASNLTLKTLINTCFIAAGIVNGGSAHSSFFTPFTKGRLAAESTPKNYNDLYNHFAANPSLLTNEELMKLAKSLSPEITKRNATFLDCDSKTLKGAERYTTSKTLQPVYDKDPTLVLLKAIGIERPEQMDNCGFLDTVYKLNARSGALDSAGAKMLPLPIRDGDIHSFLMHPTPAFAAQLGNIFKHNARIKASVSKWNSRIDDRSILSSYKSLEDPNKEEENRAREDRFARRWVMQYVFENLTFASTGKPVSPVDIKEFMTVRPSYYQGIASDAADNFSRVKALMHFLSRKVAEGEMRYNGKEYPLSQFESLEAIHEIGRKLLAQSRERRAEISDEIKAQGFIKS